MPRKIMELKLVNIVKKKKKGQKFITVLNYKNVLADSSETPDSIIEPRHEKTCFCHM